MPSADPRPTLIADACHFYKQGWMVGTAGNLSAWVSDRANSDPITYSFWITASGRPKGNLTPEDFVQVCLNGRVQTATDGMKPSAETAIHQTLYALFPEAQACYHVHSIEANLVSQFTQEDILLLPPLEMLKGLGVWEENPECFISIFPNHLEVSKIAYEIEHRFKAQAPKLPALLIRNHGVTVWASSPESARNYIELVEYIFRYMVRARQLSI